MDEYSKGTWSLGKNDLPDHWPKGPDGLPEHGAVLTRAQSELDGVADILISLLDSFGIPAIKAGVQGKVIMGFAGLGVDIYVPESRLEEARTLLESQPAEDAGE